MTAIYLNAGSGGQIAGLNEAGFTAVEAVEADKYCVATLAANLPGCRVVRDSLAGYVPGDMERGALDVLYGTVKSFGSVTDRDDVPAILAAVETFMPRAFVLESPHFILRDEMHGYREFVRGQLDRAGYVVRIWSRVDSRMYGGPSPWNAAILVALRQDCNRSFDFLEPDLLPSPSLSDMLGESMRARFSSFGQDPRARHAYERWMELASARTVPKLLDLSGVDEESVEVLHPNGILAWRERGIDASRVFSDDFRSPDRSLFGSWGPCLTVSQASLVKGFPREWVFEGPASEGYRQVAQAASPVLLREIGRVLARSLQWVDLEPQPPAPAEPNPLAEVDALSPDAFELFVADLLRRDGYRIEKAGGGAGDGGIDVHAYDLWGYPLIVQCKHTEGGERRVGAGVVRDLFGAASAMRPLPRALVVTNGSFTTPCRLWAITEDRIRLIDREQLRRWATDGLPLHEVMRPNG
ncbi:MULTISPECIES: restriction endonuclease [unclassified Streptomyces]|uniref:restriction endonuclease n=1 Tax=unclassified Streptomyces TaxID=2593676 RepID=UPI002030ECF3|nr:MULTISPECIES: restriction endonuclease [unclassified Streptomyces]MCM1969382.1 restriction endonuclease [Streptomyces sp. G1]MCX5295340.1 restriction endonuclease [Streptomyces sp. NBC_00193]